MWERGKRKKREREKEKEILLTFFFQPLEAKNPWSGRADYIKRSVAARAGSAWSTDRTRKEKEKKKREKKASYSCLSRIIFFRGGKNEFFPPRGKENVVEPTFYTKLFRETTASSPPSPSSAATHKNPLGRTRKRTETRKSKVRKSTRVCRRLESSGSRKRPHFSSCSSLADAGEAFPDPRRGQPRDRGRHRRRDEHALQLLRRRRK